jgi:hypothetical protein
MDKISQFNIDNTSIIINENNKIQGLNSIIYNFLFILFGIL